MHYRIGFALHNIFFSHSPMLCILLMALAFNGMFP